MMGEISKMIFEWIREKSIRRLRCMLIAFVVVEYDTSEYSGMNGEVCHVESPV